VMLDAAVDLAAVVVEIFVVGVIAAAETVLLVVFRRI